MLLLIDHHDSFTYNLYQYFLELDAPVKVIRVDELAGLEDTPSALILSPGPGHPAEAEATLKLLKTYHQKIPILGICLGHQIIAHFFGATVKKSPYPVHGKSYPITHTGENIFHKIPSPYTVTRYHSLAVSRETLGSSLKVTAETADGIIMGISHRELPIFGVQFHPEAILSEYGHALLQNFLTLVKDVPNRESSTI